MKRTLFLFLTCILFAVSCAPAQSVSLSTETLTQSNPQLLMPTGTKGVSAEDENIEGISSIPSQTLMPSSTLPFMTASAPTVTSTPLPSLFAHKWQPKSVLIKLETGGGDGCCLYSYPPELVVYANGRVILNRGYEENGEWRNKLMTKLFSRGELCSVLNTIDRTGFLYYDTATYRPQKSDYFSIDGAGYTAITVNSWMSNYGDFFGLFSYLQLSSNPAETGETILDDPGSPIIPPALKDVYLFLKSMSLSEAEVYKPQRLGLIVSRSDSTVITSGSPVVDWPFDTISLSEIEQITLEDDYPSKFFIVEGDTAASIYDFFGNSFDSYGENVKQDNQVYVVFLRPLLPYEIPQLHTYNILPDPSVKPPAFQLECFPSDGVLSIPKALIP